MTTRDYRIGLLEDLKDKEFAVAYLAAALEEDDEGFRMAIRNISHAWGVLQHENGK